MSTERLEEGVWVVGPVDWEWKHYPVLRVFANRVEEREVTDVQEVDEVLPGLPYHDPEKHVSSLCEGPTLQGTRVL